MASPNTVTTSAALDSHGNVVVTTVTTLPAALVGELAVGQLQNLLPIPEQQFFNASGQPLAGGTVTTYAADGVTPKATFQDQAGTILNTNPIVLNSGGFATIWGSGAYVFKVQDALGNLIYTAPTGEATAILGVSNAMLPVLQAKTTSAALALLGGQPAGGQIAVWGAVFPWAGSGIPPAPWSLCAGQAISRTAYPNLFAAIGTAWGAGDGSTTFNLPDLRGRSWFGADAMGGSAAGRLTSASFGAGVNVITGTTGGSELTQSHTHGVSDPTHSHVIPSSIEVSPGNSSHATSTAGQFGEATNTATSAVATGITIVAYGSGQSQNMPPAAVGNWIIQLG